MKDLLKPYLKRSPTNVVLHVCTNNNINDSLSFILNKLLSSKNSIHDELPESNVILSNKKNRSDNGIAMLKISNFKKHNNSLKMDIIDNGNISIEHFNDSGLHLNRHGKGKLRELHRKNFYGNWQQSEQSLARPQHYIFNCGYNNDCKRKSDTAGPKHLLEIEHTSIGNQMNSFQETRIKNANRLTIDHLNISSLRNKF